MKKSFAFLCLTVFVVQYSLAQYSDTNHVYEEFSLRGDLGTSFITVTSEDDTHIESGVSGNAGLVWTHHYEGISFFRMEFGVSIINSKYIQGSVPYLDDDGNVERIGSVTVKKRLSYLIVPMYYGVELGKFSLAAGFQAGMLMGGDEGVDSDDGPYDPDYAFCYLGSNTFDYGLRFILAWKLSHKLHLEGSYYHGLNNVTSGSCKDKNEEWKLAQLAFGIRYSFHFHVPDPTTRQIRKELREME